MKASNYNSDGAAPGLDAAAKGIRRKAADWLAKRDAGEFTLKEQAAFAEWCAFDSRHAAVFSQVESSWRTFDKLAFYPQSTGVSADPDLLASAIGRSKGFRIGFRRIFKPILLTTAAAAVLAAILSLRPWTLHSSMRASTVIARSESSFLYLPDGSEVELSAGSNVVEHFTSNERRVRLLRGEASFTVAKNPARPFIVEVGNMAVRAVGTVFDVHLGTAAIEVLVTEGVVQVRQHDTGSGDTAAESNVLTVNQRTILPTVAGSNPVKPVIETLTASEIERALAWQTARLVFDGTPLSEIVERFNRHTASRLGAPHLVLDDPKLGDVRISGYIRPDSINSFVEVLERSFGITADRRDDGEIILRKSE